MNKIILSLAALSFLFTSNVSSADTKSDIQDLRREIKELKSIIELQQRKISALDNSSNAEITTQGAGYINVKPTSQFNPDIGVVGDIVTTTSKDHADEEGKNRLSVREVELIFGHDIDPYSRFDSVFTFSDGESPDIEEAFVSYWGLPFDTKLRIGKLHPKIGRAVALHRDQLESVDEPLVIQKYFGVEGLSKSTLELSNFLPFSWINPAHEITLGISEGGVGEDGELFGEARNRPMLYTKLRNSFDINDDTNLDLGTSYILGSSDSPNKSLVNAFDIDFTLKNNLDAIRILKIQSEAIFQNRNDLESRSPWGLYTLIDYKFAERWSIGSRYDYVEPITVEGDLTHKGDTAWNGMLTYYQSEFARWRFQYQHINFATGDNDDRFFLQLTVAIGVHKHALQ